MAEEAKNCEYFLLNYLPSALRETRVAVGLFLFQDSGELLGYRLADNWRWVRCLNPQADIEVLDALPAHFEKVISETRSRVAASPRESLYARLQQMEQEYSGALQISLPRAVQTLRPDEELERLFQQYIATPCAARHPAPQREGSRSWIRARLSEALERHGLMPRIRKEVPVEEYTAPGDRFRIDFGYRPNGVTKYFHALSLERDLTQAKLLSYTFWRIQEQMNAHLTAVVEDADPNLPSVQGCRQILTSAQIALQPLSRIDAFLGEVQRELRI